MIPLPWLRFRIAGRASNRRSKISSRDSSSPSEPLPASGSRDSRSERSEGTSSDLSTTNLPPFGSFSLLRLPEPWVELARADFQRYFLLGTPRPPFESLRLPPTSSEITPRSDPSLEDA